jgi:hypothetical protein
MSISHALEGAFMLGSVDALGPVIRNLPPALFEAVAIVGGHVAYFGR